MPSAGIHSDHHLCGLSTLASRARAHFTRVQRRSGRMTPMKLPRRNFLHLAAGAAALPAMSRMASAEVYPARPVTIVVPFAAGGSTDVYVLIVGEYMRRTLGLSLPLDNVVWGG